MKENQLVHAGQGAPSLPISIGDMNLLAKSVAESKLFGMQTPAQALVLMALCQSEGKNPIQAVRQYHIINGKPSMRADAMLAEFQARGGTVQWLDRTNEKVSATFSHPSGGTLTVTWSMEDAKRAGLTGNPTWSKFPRQMLTARVISEAIRTILPGVVAGIYTPEEVADMPSVGAVLLPEEVAPAAPVRVPPFKQFLTRAAELKGRMIPVVTPDGKLSQKGGISLLSEIYGKEITSLEPPTNHVAWEGHLAALLAVYPEAPTLGEDSELTDPFADDASDVESVAQ